MKITIPGSLPTMNEIIDASKAHKMVYANMKKKHTLHIQLLARNIPKMQRVNFTIHWYCGHKRFNKDNIAAGIKFILDGLQAAGVIVNDGWKEVGDIRHHFYLDKKNPRIEVELEEVKEDAG